MDYKTIREATNYQALFEFVGKQRPLLKVSETQEGGGEFAALSAIAELFHQEHPATTKEDAQFWDAVNQAFMRLTKQDIQSYYDTAFGIIERS